MIPPTRHNHPTLVLVSAMQKSIRRGLEREAMGFACELLHSSKASFTMVCNRLEIISHEDIDTEASPWIVPFVRTATQQAREWFTNDQMKLGKARMALGNAIRMMCRAPKSREGDHFHAAIGLANLLEDYVPPIPDWAYDQHTGQGKQMGRGLDHFRSQSTKLSPAPERKDAYEDEAYRLWEKKSASKAGARLFEK